MGRIRVLLADDRNEFLAFAAQLLESDYEVVKTVSNGQVLVEEASTLGPELILLNITMPELNGIASVRQIRAAGFIGKMVFLTVHADAECRSRNRSPRVCRQEPAYLRQTFVSVRTKTRRGSAGRSGRVETRGGGQSAVRGACERSGNQSRSCSGGRWGREPSGPTGREGRRTHRPCGDRRLCPILCSLVTMGGYSMKRSSWSSRIF